jgi:hypothetical protein
MALEVRGALREEDRQAARMRDDGYQHRGGGAGQLASLRAVVAEQRELRLAAARQPLAQAGEVKAQGGGIRNARLHVCV